MDIRITPIEPDCFYHIYNRGVNGETIFKSHRNYIFFVNKIKENLLSVCEIYAYCLMPNHFHLLVGINSDSDLKKMQQGESLEIKGLHSPQNVFSKQFSKIFNSYSQSFNKENNRHGSLIESPFKRKLLSTEDYIRNCIIYIHRNPVAEHFTKFPYSSYQNILNSSTGFLKSDEVIDLFDSKENFIFCHKKGTNMIFKFFVGFSSRT